MLPSPSAAPPLLPCQAGEYHFRFMVGDSTDLHPVMAVSDKYEREEILNREGQRVMCNKVRTLAAAVEPRESSSACASCLLAAVRVLEWCCRFKQL
jgi:hypothetical protein